MPVMRTAHARTILPNRLACFICELALIKSVAKDPEAQAFGVLDAEIIARQRLPALLPPLHRDTLGAFHPHHRVGGTPPVK